MRIDSVRTFPDHTVFYPFHTARGRYYTGGAPMTLDTTGASWLGKKVVRKNDGTFLFDNIWGDTVVIRTQAGVGDTWMFYEDTSDVYYLAKVISKFTRVIYGSTDSVKKIRITAYSRSASAPVADPADGLYLSISKNFGFYDAFDLYMFPHRYVSSSAAFTPSRGDTMDYFFLKCSDQQFAHCELHLPMNEEISDHYAGDIFEYEEYCHEPTLCERYVLDTIISRLESSSQITYTIRRREIRTVWTIPSNIVTHAYSTFTKVVDKGLSDIIDTVLMPEQYGCGALYYFNAADTYLCRNANFYRRQWGALFNEFEPCGSVRALKEGLGMLYESQCFDPVPYGGESTQLIYFVKNGVACGSFVPIPLLLHSFVQTEKNIVIFPHPANTVTKVFLPISGTYYCRLTDVLGRTVYSTPVTGTEIILSCSELPAGTYVLTVEGNNREHYFQKLQIIH